jgi:hypothetical protein
VVDVGEKLLVVKAILRPASHVGVGATSERLILDELAL